MSHFSVLFLSYKRVSVPFHVFHQLLEAETLRHIFMNNYQLCNEISDRVVHHFVHCIETHGRHVQYLKFLETIVKADGKYVKKCQDKVMTEVRMTLFSRHLNPHDGSPASTDHLNNVKHVSVINIITV